MLLISINTIAQAPNYLWAKGAGGTGSEYSRGVATDGSGNVLVTGSFTSPTITFGTTTLNNAGSTNIFIVKYDASGTVLWAKSAGGTDNDFGFGVATDGSGNVLVTGWFRSPTITFGTTTLTNAGLGNMFIVKYDASGTVLWAKSAGGTDNDYGRGVATDGSGNVLVTGQFSSPTITFGTTTLTTLGNYVMFVAKYDASGTVLWAKGAGGTGDNFGNGVATDGSGNVLVTGGFTSPTITFGTTTLTNAGNVDMFVAKYDASGTVLWAKGAGGTGDDFGYGVATDGSGNVLVTGQFSSQIITFGTTALNYAGGSDIFIVKYDASGTVLWAKGAGGTDNDCGFGVATDGSGNVLVTGQFSSPTITFGTTTLNNAGSTNIFIVKYDASGTVLWAKGAGGLWYDYGFGVATDGSGNVLVIGYFSSPTITFGTTTLTNAGNYDMFVAKLSAINGIESVENSTGISVYPNPATTLLNIHHSTSTSPETLLITDLLGTVVYKENLCGIDNTISISTWSAGIYFYEVRSEKESTRGKFVVQK